MNKSSKAIFWVVVFFLVLLATDQFLLRVEFKSGGMQVARSFYLDFRQRLFRLGGDDVTIESVIEQKEVAPPAAVIRRNEPDAPRYIYADDNGNLQFADSLEDIPPQHRAAAERMDN